MKQSAWSTAILLLGTLSAVHCSPAPAPAHASPGPAPALNGALTWPEAGGPDDGQWVMAAKDYRSTRFSGLDEINLQNAATAARLA